MNNDFARDMLAALSQRPANLDRAAVEAFKRQWRSAHPVKLQ